MSSTPTWFEGFEGGDLSSAFGSYITGTCSISGVGIGDTTKHEGNFAFKANPDDGVEEKGCGYIYKALVATGAMTGNLDTNDCYVSVFIKAAARPASDSEQILVFTQDNTDRLQVHLRSDGKLELFDESDSSIGVSTTVLGTGTWYLVEVKYKYVDLDTCECELRIDGASEVTSTEENFPSDDVDYLVVGKIRDKNNKGYTCYFDDIAICDDGYVEQPFLVKAVVPDADGNYTAWTGSYTDIDEAIPDGDTTTINSTGTGQQQSASCASVSAIVSGRSIVAVRSLYLLNRGYTTTVKIFWRDSDGTDNKTASAFTLGEAYNNPLAQFYTEDPVTSAAWTISGINASEIGVECITASVPADSAYWTSGKIHLALAGSAGRVMIAYNFGG